MALYSDDIEKIEEIARRVFREEWEKRERPEAEKVVKIPEPVLPIAEPEGPTPEEG